KWEDFALVKRVDLQMPDGRTIEGLVFNDPRARIQEATLKISEMLKDGNNKPIIDNNGAQLAKTDKGEVVVVKEVSGAGKFSDELLEAWSKFDDNVLDVASVGKQNWKTFQNRVGEQLQSLHPGKKIGNQITLDVTYTLPNGSTVTKTIIPDNLIQIEVNGIKKYKVIDAKTAQTDLVNKADLTSTCTQNQQPIYKMIDGDATAGTITKVEMRGGQAEQAFGDLGSTGKLQIQLESNVEFWVNTNPTDFTQYLIRPRIKLV
ncbi:MAG: hypothetical protein SNJ77_11640, partial [Cytophagales bacterium]